MNTTVPATTASASDLSPSVLQMLYYRGYEERARAQLNCCLSHATDATATTASASDLSPSVLQMLYYRGCEERARARLNCYLAQLLPGSYHNQVISPSIEGVLPSKTRPSTARKRGVAFLFLIYLSQKAL
jgi:hypothetical protein